MGFIVIILIGVLFHFKAKKNNLNKYLWTFIGVISFFIGIIIAALIFVIIDTNIIMRKISTQTELICGLAGLFNSVIAWLMLQSKINEGKW